MTVVTFIDFTPIPRADADPWTSVRVEESAHEVGPWASIDTLTLDPVDEDPTNPASRTLTTEHATLLAGWYRLVWIDASADESSPTDPIHHTTLEQSYWPSVPDIGAILRARTVTENMQELGTFTKDTRPTAADVDRLIAQAADDVTTSTGTELPESVWRMAKSLIALRAAMLVELSYFPSQVRSDKSAYAEYERMYDARLAKFEKIVEDAQSGVPSGTGGMPSYSFPEDVGGMVGWGTVW